MIALLMAVRLTAPTHNNQLPIVNDRCERLEINHCYDRETGRKYYTQITGWNWDDQLCDWRCEWYRIVSKENRDWRSIGVTHLPPGQGGGYRMIWVDKGLLRRVDAVQFRETWTTYDPEMMNRDKFEKEFRRGLLMPISDDACPTVVPVESIYNRTCGVLLPYP